jgi:hypothetical protein
MANSRYFSPTSMKTFNAASGAYVQKSSALVWGLLFTLCFARLASASTPLNDDFANRAVLLGSNGVMQGSLTNATREAGEPSHAVYGESGSLWWTWTAQTDSSIEIKILPGFQISKIAQVVAVYRGNDINSLQEIASDSGIWSHPLQFRVAAGETYQIAACDLGGLARPVTLSLEEIPLPVNDNFENRLLLTAGQDVHAASFLATLEPNEPVNEYGLNRSLWWTWTAPTEGVVSFSTSAGIHIYSGNALSELIERSSYLSYRVQAGEVIQVRSDEPRTFGNFPAGFVSFRLNFLAVPGNDFFADRTPLSGLPVEVSGYNALATTDTNKVPRSAYIPPGSVWYEWTAPKTTRVSVWIEGGGTPHVTAFTGNSFSTLKPIGRLGRREAPITFLARQDRKYVIAVGSVYESGSFTLRILPPPPNDLFNDAAELTGVYAEAEGYTSGAWFEAREPRLDPTATRESIWWNWRAPLSGLAIVQTDGDYYLPPFAIFDGNSLASLRRVPILSANVGDFGYSTASFNAASGTVYRIAAAGYRFHDGTMIDEVNGRVSIAVAVSTLEIISPAPGSVFSPGALVSGTVRTAFPDIAPPLIDVAAYTAAAQEVARTSASAPDYQFTLTNLPTGRLYLIAAGTSALPPPVFSPALPIRVHPVNDDFAQRALIPRLPALISGSLAGSTFEPAEPAPRGPAAVGSLWWTWTAPSNGTVLLVSSYLTVEVFRGESLASIKLVTAITDDPRTYTAPEGTFKAIAGQTYHFRSTGPESGACYASLAWLSSNDNFADRVMLTGTNLIIEANNSGATTEPGEPFPGGFVGGSSLWWSWTAPQNGTLFVTRTNSMGILAVFRGEKLTELELLYPEGQKNDPVVPVVVQAGVSYQIALHAASSGQVNPTVTMYLRFVPDSPNDNFADALPLTGTQVLFGGANYNATRETGEPIRSVLWFQYNRPSRHPVNATLWWRWTAPATGIVTISTVPGDFRPFVEMFEGNDLLSLQSLVPPIQVDFLSITDSIDFPVESGHEYYISAGGINNQRGEFQLLLQAP